MTVIPVQSDLLFEAAAVQLPEYARVIGMDECAILGVAVSGQTQYACGEVWTWSERRLLVDALSDAQSEIESELKFTLAPEWQVEEGPYVYPYLVKWRKVIAGGVKGVTSIQLAHALNHATDPVTIVPVATTVTDVDEIKIFHPGTDIEIIPSWLVIAGGTVNIEIPRCRTLTLAHQDDAGGADYGTLANFEATVDIKRVYNDVSTNALLRYPHTCSHAACGCTCGCTEATHPGCIYVRNSEMGIVDIRPATYAAASGWTGSIACICNPPQIVTASYYAGLQVDRSNPKSYRDWTRLREAVIRLAHSKMPSSPCSKCDIATNYWTRDRSVPQIISKEREGNPFGPSEAGWFVYKQVSRLKKMRMFVL